LKKTIKTVPAHIPVPEKESAVSVSNITDQEMRFQGVSSVRRPRRNMTGRLNTSCVQIQSKNNVNTDKMLRQL